MYLGTVPTRRRRGLGRLGSQAMPLALANPTYTPPSDASSCSAWDFFFNPSAWIACQTAAGVAQIQSVPQNAAAAGYPPDVVAVAQQTADQQSAQLPSDISNVGQFYAAGSLVQPSTIPTWLWIALGVGGGLLVLAVVK